MTKSFYGTELSSPLMLGTAQYPSPDILRDAVRAARPGVVTVSLRRASAGERAGPAFWGLIQDLGVPVLHNTPGCHTGKAAATTAPMARPVFRTDWPQLAPDAALASLRHECAGLL